MTAQEKRIFSRIAFWGLLTITLVIALLYLYNIIAWGKLPDRGFYIRSATGIRVVGIVTEAGRKTGIEVGDFILRVNGKTFSNMKEFRAALILEIGSQNTYLLERKGQPFEVTITNVPIGIQRAFFMSGLPYLTGLCYVLIGILVFLMKPYQRTTWIFWLATTAMGLLLTFIFKAGPLTPQWLGTVHIFLYAFVPTLIMHVAITFPEERTALKKFPLLQFLPYLASAILFIIIRSTVEEFLDVPKKWFILLFGYLAMAALIFILSNLQLWLRSSSPMVRVRSKMILLGILISSIPYISDALSNALFHIYLVPNFNYHLPFLLAFPFCTAYSIVKHNLFDIDRTVKRTFGYILATIGIAGIYTLFALVPPLIFGKVEFLGTAAFPIVFTLVLLFFFNLARNRIQQFIDRVFYRLEYDYQETVQRISEAMRSLLSLDQIGKKMLEIASGVLFAEKSLILALNPKEQFYDCITDSAYMKLPTDDPLILKLELRRSEVTRFDIEEDPFFEKEKERCQKTFDRLEAMVIIPLIFEERLVGIMSLGNKKSGKFYQRQDINLLKTLANQAALAIENVRLYQARIEALESSRKELEQLNRAKSIALDHLSHELKTPLSVIQGSVRILKRKLEMQGDPGKSDKSFETLERQLNRLIEIQRETNEIIQSYQEWKEEPVLLFPLAEKTVERTKQQAGHRDLRIHLEGEMDLSVFQVPKILEDALKGLIRNAIENTPDEGMIHVKLEQKAQWIELKVQDFGVGITDKNQKHLFDGLFHTQGAQLYASKQPYDFGAGGKGLDLLKIKVYSQRFGFDISASSQRCIFLPTDQDLCPGRISLCPHCKVTKDCLSSGGSTFCLTFSTGEKREDGQKTFSQ